MKKALMGAVVMSLLLSITWAQADELTGVQFYGYKVTHHMGAMIQHLDKFGFNTFDHPPMPDHRFFVITPALDHFYSKAIIDTRWGPVIVETPARDDRYGSLLVTDMEHFGIYAEVTDPKGQRFVVIHEDYKGPIPEGTVIRTKSDFPLIFLRTQSFAFNEDKLFDDLDKNRCEMCGGGTAIAAMKAARLLGANKSEILSYRNSGDVFGEKSEVVGYLSAVQYKLDIKKRF